MPKKAPITKALDRLRAFYKKKSMLGMLADKDPFFILISTVLSARNRDSVTVKLMERLMQKYKSPEEIAHAPVEDLERILRTSGLYRIKARRIKEISEHLVTKHKGRVPQDMESLLRLPGVGRKTAGCVLVYAFEKPAIPVDTHVHRISNRLGWARTKAPTDTEKTLMKTVPKAYWTLVNELLVLHGQNICKPLRPDCRNCPLDRLCPKIGVKAMASTR